MNQLKELLLAKQTTLRSFLQESKAIRHPVGNGDNSEGGWKKFLKEILPQKYGVETGFVIDCKGNVSEQIDIIIYDNLYSPYIMTSGVGIKYIPAEAVYAIIEVKPTINKKNLEYANNKVQSVKELNRTTRGVTVAGQRKPKRKLTNILGIIFAKDSKIENEENMKKHLKTFANMNIVCAIDRYTILCTRDNCKIEIEKVEYDDALLGLYFYLNNELYELGTVAGIDIREYANSLDCFNFSTKEDFRTIE